MLKWHAQGKCNKVKIGNVGNVGKSYDPLYVYHDDDRKEVGKEKKIEKC